MSECVEKDYDRQEEICLATPEDESDLTDLRLATGRVYGKDTYFLLEKIPFRSGPGHQQWLRHGEVHSSFMAMVKEAEKHFDFGVNSSYRTWRHQRRLWREMPDVAVNPYRAGARSHMTGYSVDFSGTYAFVSHKRVKAKWFSKKWCRAVEGGFRCPTRFFWWLRKNAHKYGFKNTVKSEPWHWKFVAKQKGKN